MGKERINFSNFQKDTLVKYFNEGLTSTKKVHADTLKKVSEEIGVDIQSVKVGVPAFPTTSPSIFLPVVKIVLFYHYLDLLLCFSI